MSESPESLRRKIGSAGDLQSVVRAMKAQAAASVGQYEKAVAALSDYAHTVELALGVCLRGQAPPNEAPPPQRAPPGGVVRAVVFGSDQGLVGRFNDIVLDLARTSLAALPRTAQVWAVGDRIRTGLTDSGVSLAGTFAVPESVGAITGLVGRILVEVALPGDSQERAAAATGLHLFFNRPTLGAGFEPATQRLLPLDETWLRTMAATPWPTAMLPEVLGDTRIDDTRTLRALIGEYLFVSIFRASADSLASENASRLEAMDRADRNIDRMLTALQGRLHRLRQGNIDEELSDLISGFKALQRMPGRPP